MQRRAPLISGEPCIERACALMFLWSCFDVASGEPLTPRRQVHAAQTVSRLPLSLTERRHISISINTSISTVADACTGDLNIHLWPQHALATAVFSCDLSVHPPMRSLAKSDLACDLSVHFRPQH